ncbi:MAG: hypothetical protein KGJ07_05185 [Patescibacteria group bacterium]|nr:hypothetical protein [Patescibacteria group bacterium]MDE2588521.1 hypothetical protein [Patescibacteria group bacterium]
MGTTDVFFDLSSTQIDIPDGKQFQSWKLKIFSKEEFQILEKKQQLLYLASFGILAPSTHNTVPERFIIHPEPFTIDIFIDQTHVLPQSDPVGRQTAVSIGCTLTNMQFVAAHYGLDTIINLIHNKISPFHAGENRYTHMIKVQLIPTSGEKHVEKAWLKAMLKRKVIRAEFDSTQKLPEDIMQQLLTVVKTDYSYISFHLITDKFRIHSLGKFEELAMRTVVEKEKFALELGEWLLPNNDAASFAMRGREFGFDDTYAQKIHKGLLQQERLLPDEIAAFATGGKIMMNSSPAIGVITIQQDIPSQQIEAGRFFEYTALLLQQHGFTTAVHAGITEVDYVNRMFAVALRTRERPTVVFRIGKPLSEKDWERPHSARPLLEELILEH